MHEIEAQLLKGARWLPLSCSFVWHPPLVHHSEDIKSRCRDIDSRDASLYCHTNDPKQSVLSPIKVYLSAQASNPTWVGRKGFLSHISTQWPRLEEVSLWQREEHVPSREPSEGFPELLHISLAKVSHRAVLNLKLQEREQPTIMRLVGRKLGLAGKQE